MSTPTLQLAAGAVLISFAPVFVRGMETPPTLAAFWRCLVGGLALLVLAWATRGEARMPRGRALGFALLAGVFFALDLAAWHRSIRLVGPGLATLLVNLQVFVLAAYERVVGRRPLSGRQWVAMALALLGLSALLGAGPGMSSDESRLGVALGFVCTLVYAGYILGLRHARAEESSPLFEVGIASLAAALALLPLLWVAGERLGPVPTREVWLLAGYALVPQVLGWVLISRSQTKLPPSRVGLILLLQPALAFVWDVVFFARVTGPGEVLGLLVTLLGVALGVFAAGGAAAKRTAADRVPHRSP